MQIKIQFSDVEGIKMTEFEKETHLEEAEQVHNHMTADRMATKKNSFFFSP